MDQTLTMQQARTDETLAGLLWDSFEAHADATAQSWHENGAWHSRTYGDFADRVKQVAYGLLALGTNAGDRVALWSRNCPEWAEVDLANQSVGFVTVPIYDTLTASDAAYILADSGSGVTFVQNEELLDRLWADKDAKKAAGTIVLMQGNTRRRGVLPYKEFLEQGAAYATSRPKAFGEARERVRPDDLASLVYTSGTTGPPKGVMLSHANFTSNARAAQSCVDIGPEDTFLSFLPLSHVFERTGGHFTAYGAGAQVAFARSIDTLVEDMGQVRPTIMMSVPRLYEKIHARVQENVRGSSILKRWIFEWAIGVGKAANVYRVREEPVPKALAGKLRRAEKLVFKKLQDRVGGRLRYFVSGGAALDRRIEEFFWAAGIPILQGYGLTETSPVTHVNRPGAVRFGSVGKPVPGTDVKIDTTNWTPLREEEEGEICVRGPQVMQGYYRNKSATKEVMDKDGFFHTGDIGYVDADGFLFITDRMKEIIVMSNGKNVAPQPIENLLKLQPHIEQACLIGNDRKYITALLSPDFEALEHFALANGVDSEGTALVADQRVVSLLEKEVEAVNAQLARYQQIKKFWIMPQSWSIDSGELTPKMSIKRRVINEKFGGVIETLYPKE